MKKFFLSLVVMSTLNGFGQDSLRVKAKSLETRAFSLTPRHRKIVKVNGLAFGLGLTFFIDENSIKKLNGVNVEINPIAPLILLMADPEIGGLPNNSSLIHNGLSVSTGNFNRSSLNGLGISASNLGYSCNGVSISGLYNYTTNLNGLHISGLWNFSKKGNGVLIAAFNNSETYTGIQIGLFNHSKNLRGMQFGLWNTNSKRKLPILNWQFKA